MTAMRVAVWAAGADGSCAVHASLRGAGAAVLAGGEGRRVVLTTAPAEDVARDEVLVSAAALSALGLENGAQCDLELHDVCSAVDSATLVFEGYRSRKHWDEFSAADLLEAPGCWMGHVPKGLCRVSVANMIPSLLSSRCVVHGCSVILRVLDVDMMFRVDLASAEAPVSRVERTSRLLVLWAPASSSAPRQGLCAPAVLDFARAAWERALDHVDALPSHHTVHALALSGGAGAGKTSFLRQLAAACPDALYASLSAAPSASLSTEPAVGEVEPWVASLSFVLGALFRVSLRPTALVEWLLARSRLVLLVDDLDALLSLLTEEAATKDEVDEAIALAGRLPAEQDDALRALGRHLHALTTALLDTRGPPALRGVLLVCATRVDPAKLPRDKQSPELEAALHLRKPGLRDRAALLAARMAAHPAFRGAGAAWAEDAAALTRGYAPGDLQVVLERAHTLALGDDGPVAWTHVVRALAGHQLASLRPLDVSPPRDADGLGWGSIAGCAAAVCQVQRALRPLLAPRDLLGAGAGALQARLPRGMVLHGPSGCGKTLLGRIVATEMRMNLLCVRSTDVLSKFFGQTEARLREIFRAARSASPCLLFFDDFDALAHRRGLAGESAEDAQGGLRNRVLSTFLNELDGLLSGGPTGGEDLVFVLAACRDLAALDEALLRPGRLHEHVALEAPDAEAFEAILRLHATRLPCADLDVEKAARRVWDNGASLGAAQPTGALAEALCLRAQLLAVREAVQAKEAAGEAAPALRHRHFLCAADELCPPAAGAFHGQFSFNMGV